MVNTDSCCRNHDMVKKHIRYNLEHRADEYLRGKLEKSYHKQNSNALYCVGTAAAAIGSLFSILVSADWAAVVAIPPTAVSIVECIAAYDRYKCAKIRIIVIKDILKGRHNRGVLYFDNYSNIKIQNTFMSLYDRYNETDHLLTSEV